MPKLLDPGFLAKAIGGPLGKQVNDATLIVVTSGARTPGELAGGTNPTTTSHAAKGFEDSYDSSMIDGKNIFVSDRKVSLFGSTIAGGKVPKPNDRVTIAGNTYRIVSVGRDPASVLYECQCRKVT